MINNLQQKGIHIFINFNMSANCLDQDNVCIEMLCILAGLRDKSLLNIEITEQCQIVNKKVFQGNLCELSRHFNIFIDDFGTGFCNIDYLIDNPITGIKIDKDFTDNAVNKRRNFVFIESIIKTSINAGMKVIIEGIETERELNWASDLKCQYGQGYYWNKPISLPNFILYYKKFLIGGTNEQEYTEYNSSIAKRL